MSFTFRIYFKNAHKNITTVSKQQLKYQTAVLMQTERTSKKRRQSWRAVSRMFASFTSVPLLPSLIPSS